MTKKHYVKTVEDIKYCEEKGIELYDDYQAIVCFKFVDGVWCSYTNKNLNAYNVKLSFGSLYYEEESEEQTEATEKDVGKLCWFWYEDTTKGKEAVGVLLGIATDEEVRFESDENFYLHCRPLTKAEIQEFMEKAE